MNLRTVFLFIISLVIGVTFLYSAYTKTLPIEIFEYTIVEYVGVSWRLASILARMLIGIELGLGALLITNIYGSKKWVLKLSITILIIFSIYLSYLWIKEGNNVNCGCFGDAIWMSPSASLLKNLVLIALILLLNRFHTGLHFKSAHIVSISLLTVLCAFPFFYFPVSFTNDTVKLGTPYKMDLSPLYEAKREDIPSVNLSRGKHIIAFLSLTCPHCKVAAQKMHIMKKNDPTLPFFFILNGDKEQLPIFFEKTNATNIPHTMLLGENFVHMAALKQFGFALPAIYLVNNGIVESRTNYMQLDQGAIEEWLKKN